MNEFTDGTYSEIEEGSWLDRLQTKLGLRFVAENHVQAVYRDQIYRTAKGPGWFRIHFWNETSGEIIKIGPRFGTLTLDNLSSREPAQVGLELSVSYTFDPRRTKREIAVSLIKLPDQVFEKMIEGAVLKPLRPLIASYSFEEIRLGRIYEHVERMVNIALQADKGLRDLGIEVGGMQIVKPILSRNLNAHLERYAELDSGVLRSQQYDAEGLIRALSIKIVDQLRTQATAGNVVMTTDVIHSLQELVSRTAAPIKMIDVTPSVNSMPAERQPMPSTGSYTVTDGAAQVQPEKTSPPSSKPQKDAQHGVSSAPNPLPDHQDTPKPGSKSHTRRGHFMEDDE